MRRVMALFVVLAACSGTATETTRTSSQEPSATTPAATAVVKDAVQQINVGRNAFLDPGVVYEYTGLPVTVRLEFDQEGWLVDFSAETLLALVTTSSAMLCALVQMPRPYIVTNCGLFGPRSNTR